MLSLLAEREQKPSMLRESYPSYYMSKDKVPVSNAIKPSQVIHRLEENYEAYPKETLDGLKLWFQDRSWVHLRESNTEPVIRIYAESPDEAFAESTVQEMRKAIESVQS
jgi:phosphomannomutase